MSTTNLDLAVQLATLAGKIDSLTLVSIEREGNKKEAAEKLDHRLARMEAELDALNSLKNRGMGWIGAITVAVTVLGGAVGAWISAVTGGKP